MTDQLTEFVPLDGGVGVLLESTASAVRSFAPGTFRIQTYSLGSISRKGEIKDWGEDNNLPSEREKLIADNPVIGPLLQTKADLAIGQGLFPFQKIIENGKTRFEEVHIPSEASDFFEKVGIHAFLDESARQYFIHSNTFSEFIRSMDGSMITNLSALESRHIRAFRKSGRRVLRWAYSKKWADDTRNKGVRSISSNREKSKFIIHGGDNFFNDGYYNEPTYWGSRWWIRTSNNIPIFHDYNIMNGYTIRWHIRIPIGYFEKKGSSTMVNRNDKALQDSASKAKAKFIADLNDYLAGKKNAGRALVTTYDASNAMMKKWPGIEIEALNPNLQDTALLDLFEKSLTAIMSSVRLEPSLASVQVPNKMSSGSDIRNSYAFHLAVKTAKPRRELAAPINFIAKENNWHTEDNIVWKFKDIELTKLDQNPTSTQTVVGG